MVLTCACKFAPFDRRAIPRLILILSSFCISTVDQFVTYVCRYLAVTFEHSRVLTIFCSTVFTSDHPIPVTGVSNGMAGGADLILQGIRSLRRVTHLRAVHRDLIPRRY